MDLDNEHSTSLRAPERAHAPRQSGPLGALAEPALDRLTGLASRLLRCPAAVVCAAGEDRPVILSVRGPTDAASNSRPMPIDESFCRCALAAKAPVAIEDIRQPEALRANPVLAELGIVSYAGVPLLALDGHVLGSLSVVDVRPRQWSSAELADLNDLAALAASELQHRLHEADRHRLDPRLVRAERARAIGQLAGGIAHDFNNLLTGIIGHVALLQEEPGLSEVGREDLAQIHRSADRAAGLTRQLLAYSRRQVLAPRVLDLNQLVAGCLSTLRRLMGERVQVVSMPAPRLDPVVADPNQLEHVLTQLCANARESMPDGGTLEIATRQERIDTVAAARLHGLRSGTYVLMEVRDTGRGMDGPTLERIFEPFYSTKAPSAGAGLGLASVYGIVKQSSGHIEAVSAPGQGATFTIYLPRHEGSGPVGAAERPREPGGGTETILLVEDEAQVRELARRVLQRAGYTVLAAPDGEAATAIADRHPGHIHLLITDMLLPHLGGRELAARLGIHRPAIKVIYVSGTSDSSIARLRLVQPGMEFLEKPFSLDRLLRTVRQALGGEADGGSRPT
ncbi:MAG: response regulator [Gemmatimonadales bacterium]|nr:response regulator [Gemmatimonadales bacterium]